MRVWKKIDESFTEYLDYADAHLNNFQCFLLVVTIGTLATIILMGTLLFLTMFLLWSNMYYLLLTLPVYGLYLLFTTYIKLMDSRHDK